MLWFWLALSGATLWGLSYALLEPVLKSGMNSLSLMALYTWIAAPVFTFVAWRFGTLGADLAMTRSNPRIVLTALTLTILYFIANILVYSAIRQKDATTVSFIEISYPLFVALFSYLLFHSNHLTPATALGGALILGGVSVIYWGK